MMTKPDIKNRMRRIGAPLLAAGLAGILTAGARCDEPPVAQADSVKKIEIEVTVRPGQESERRNISPTEGPTLYSIGNDERTAWSLAGDFDYPIKNTESIKINQRGERISFRTSVKGARFDLNWTGTYKNGVFEATTTYYDTTGNKRTGIDTYKYTLRLEGELEYDGSIRGTSYSTMTSGKNIDTKRYEFTLEPVEQR